MDPLLDKNIISTKAASELSGYSPDYLSRLARSGKIRGTQVGRTWVVQKESLLEFMGTQGKRKEELARALARTRANEYRERTKAAFTPRTFTFARAPKIERTPRHASIRVPVSFIRHAASALAALVVVSGAAYAAEAAD